jgi:alkylated DNA repair protein alkB family protein 1
VFLIGGATREVRPAAVCLRSGDAVVIGGDARRWFHGVPRVFAPDDPVVVSRRSKGVFEEGRHEEGFTQEGFTQEGRHEEGFSVRAPREVGDPDAWPEERDVAERVAQGARVNLSLREGIYESRRDAYSTSSR